MAKQTNPNFPRPPDLYTRPGIWKAVDLSTLEPRELCPYVVIDNVSPRGLIAQVNGTGEEAWETAKLLASAGRLHDALTNLLAHTRSTKAIEQAKEALAESNL